MAKLVTDDPQWWHKCRRHNGTPSLRPVAMCTVLLSILSPAEDAFSHAPASEVDVTRRRARVAGSGALSSRL